MFFFSFLLCDKIWFRWWEGKKRSQLLPGLTEESALWVWVTPCGLTLLSCRAKGARVLVSPVALCGQGARASRAVLMGDSSRPSQTSAERSTPTSLTDNAMARCHVKAGRQGEGLDFQVRDNPIRLGFSSVKWRKWWLAEVLPGLNSIM